MSKKRESRKPTYCEPMFALGDRRSWSLLLHKEPRKPTDDPIEVGEQKSVLIDQSVASKR